MIHKEAYYVDKHIFSLYGPWVLSASDLKDKNSLANNIHPVLKMQLSHPSLATRYDSMTECTVALGLGSYGSQSALSSGHT